jgi:hypothetical protein
MSTIDTTTAALSTAIEQLATAIEQSIQQAIAALPVPVTPSPVLPVVFPSHFPNYLDPRDFKAVWDGIADDTEAIQNCWNAALNTSNPNEIVMPPGRALTGPLVIPGPGVYVRGCGLIGATPADNARATVLVARNAPEDVGPMVRVDAAISPNVGWLRNVGVEYLAVDVLGCSRFFVPNPPPLFSFLGVSNCRDFRGLGAFGNVGTVVYVGSATWKDAGGNITASVISENITIQDLWDYAGYNEDGSYNSLQPVAPLVIASGVDQFEIYDGLLAFGCSTLPLTARYPAILITPEVVNGVLHIAQNGTRIEGVRMTNMPIGVKVAVIDFQRPTDASLVAYGPRNVLVWNVLMEGVASSIEVGMDPVKGSLNYFSGSNIFVSGCTDGVSSISVNNAVDSCIEMPYGGTIALGPATSGVRTVAGRNAKVTDATKTVANPAGNNL